MATDYTTQQLMEIRRQQELVARDGASPAALAAFCAGAKRATGWDPNAGLNHAADTAHALTCTGWVCEQHPHMAWPHKGEDGADCPGPGLLCDCSIGQRLQRTMDEKRDRGEHVSFDDASAREREQ